MIAIFLYCMRGDRFNNSIALLDLMMTIVVDRILKSRIKVSVHVSWCCAGAYINLGYRQEPAAGWTRGIAEAVAHLHRQPPHRWGICCSRKQISLLM